jgi:hypothetical protein
MKYLTLLVALLLTGCLTAEQRIAKHNAEDNQKCLGYGAQVGSSAYVNCRAQLDSARTTADAIEDAAPVGASIPVPASDAPKLQPMNITGPRCTSRGC